MQTLTLKNVEFEKAKRDRRSARLPHLSGLDELRGVAIILVLIHHCICWSNSTYHAQALNAFEKPIEFVAEWCDSGVDLFFVLSGFLITRILLAAKSKPNYFRNFYARRALRIYPLYYAYLLLVFCVFPLMVKDPVFSILQREAVFYFFYVGNISMIIHLTPTNMFLLHTWSLSVEEQFYCIWPLVVKLCNAEWLKRSLYAIIFGALVLRVLLLDWLKAPSFETHIFTLCRLDAFAFGALGLIILNYSKNISTRSCTLACLPALLMAIAQSKFHIDLKESLGLTLVPFAFTGVLMAVLSGKKWSALIQNALLRRFGKYSYSIYLFHFPILLLIHRCVVPKIHACTYSPLLTWAVCFGSVCLSSFAVGAFTYHFFERYFLRAKVHFN